MKLVSCILILKYVLLGNSFAAADSVQSFSFKEVIEKISGHDSVRVFKQKGEALKEESYGKGSWGDPHLKIAAKNFPKDSFADNRTPMTGVEISLSQKVSLTTKFGNLKDSYLEMARSATYRGEHRRRFLIKELWMLAIERRKVLEDREIVQENINWISKMLSISKKLYANGKTSQQALLEVQIRKSELETQLSNLSHELIQIDAKVAYLFTGDDSKLETLDLKTVPWDFLESGDSQAERDYEEKALSTNLHSKSLALSASRLAYVPDLTFSIGYTKRANIDGQGDFVGASVSFPIPTSSKEYSDVGRSVHEKSKAESELRDYRRTKERKVKVLKSDIEKIRTELKILEGKTIKYAMNSRDITAKSYSLGSATYFELLRSELKLQSLLLNRSMLKSKLANQLVNFKFVSGEKLYE